MTREKWKLTKAATSNEPQIDAWGDSSELRLDRDREDLTLGFSFMKALADADDTLVEVEDGVWRHSVLDAAFGDAGEGVEKIGEGAYRVRKDWLIPPPPCGQGDDCQHGDWISGAC